MACKNCHNFKHLCKAVCCSFVPIDRQFYIRHIPDVVRPIKEWVGAYGVQIPITEDGHCPFLNDHLECNVYEDRPEICRLYGNETHINLTCQWQTADGLPRNEKDRKKINDKQIEVANKFINQTK